MQALHRSQEVGEAWGVTQGFDSGRHVQLGLELHASTFELRLFDPLTLADAPEGVHAHDVFRPHLHQEAPGFGAWLIPLLFASPPGPPSPRSVSFERTFGESGPWPGPPAPPTGEGCPPPPPPPLSKPICVPTCATCMSMFSCCICRCSSLK